MHTASRFTNYLKLDMEKILFQCLPIDAVGAVCGSETNCTLARMCKRQILNLTYVRVRPNYMILCNEDYKFHFSISDKAFKTIELNDSDQNYIERPFIFTSYLIGKAAKRQFLTEAQKDAVRSRVRIGRSEGRYVSKIRLNWAKEAGKAGKLLRQIQHRELEEV